MSSGYKNLDSTTISFGVAPRINACGRMGHADEALNLFLSKDIYEVNELTKKLNDYNKMRQEKEKSIYEDAVNQIEKNKLYKTIEKIGIVCNFEPEKPQELSNRIKYICNAYSVNIDNSTLAYFIECCGTNLQDLINEIRKLIEYKGKGGQITKEDIDILSIRQFDSVIFDLTDNLGKKDITGALQVLQNLIYAKEPLAKILVTLYNHFKKLYITKMALNTSFTPAKG